MLMLGSMATRNQRRAKARANRRADEIARMIGFTDRVSQAAAHKWLAARAPNPHPIILPARLSFRIVRALGAIAQARDIVGVLGNRERGESRLDHIIRVGENLLKNQGVSAEEREKRALRFADENILKFRELARAQLPRLSRSVLLDLRSSPCASSITRAPRGASRDRA
jgi:hypothetical protein